MLVGSVFKGGERVDVIGTSRGKGFQGVMKRHHFAGGAATHGSMFHRAPGSIGASSYPSRVVKGMRAAGHMGAERVTTLNLRVERVDADEHLLMLRGAVPGARGSYVIVRKAVAAKPEPKPQVEKVEEGQEVAMTLDIVNAQNEKIGSLELRDEVFGGRVKTDLIWQSVVRDNAADRRGTHATKTRGAGQRHRQEAVQAEGHRPRAGRRDAQPAVAQGRHGVRPAAAQLRVRAAEARRSAAPCARRSPRSSRPAR